jgi:GT2 family glycosyltransferase
MIMKEEIKNKKIVFSIIMYNAVSRLADLIESLKAQDYPQELLEFVFVDNNSVDDSLLFVKNNLPQAKIIENKENLGFATANNQAYELAKKLQADYFFLLNDDTIIEKDCLNQLVKEIEKDDQIVAVQAKLLLHPQTDLINSYGNNLNFLGFGYCGFYKKKNQFGPSFEVPYPSGGACLLKMSALDKVGLFEDDFFMYHEDVDLGWKLKLAGYKSVFSPSAVVYHKYNFKNSGFKYYYLERNRLLVLLKNYKLGTLIILAPIFFFMELGILVFALRGGWLKEKISGYFWLIKNFKLILLGRKKIKKIRKIKDQEILKLMCAKIDFEEVNNFLLKNIANPVLSLYLFIANKIIFW